VTTGVVVSSAIATGGFAILAAGNFRGTADAASPDGTTSRPAVRPDAIQAPPQGTTRQPRVNGFGTPGDTGGQVPTAPRSGSGRGHVSMGSS
jgi:hypothetical protein